MPKNLSSLFFALLTFCTVVLLLPSCKVTKTLPEGQSLLTKNKFIFKTKLKNAEKEKVRDDLAKIAAQKPNIRFFGIMPFRMWLYNSATRGKKLTKFKQWIIDKVGEAPVVYDSTLKVKSVSNMENYLFNYGYFHAHVTDTIITKKKRTQIHYNIQPNELWKIGDVELPGNHNTCDSLVRDSRKATFLKKGDRFSIVSLKNERDRIENVLRNKGYYFFNREYVTFDLDTSTKRNTVNIKITINQPSDSAEHEQYRINNIYIVSDYAVEQLNDSTHRDTVMAGEYMLIAQKPNFRKGVLIDAVYFKHDDLYMKDNELKTINRFSQLGAFRFVSLDYSRVKDAAGNYLDCIISLTPAKRQAVTATGEINVTNEGLFGTAATLSYKNKNLTKGADQLQFDVSTGVQLKFSKKENVQVITANAGVNVTYYINKFLVPFRAKIFSRNTNPRTKISLGYNFEHRFDFDTLGNVAFLYQLHYFNFAFGYEWAENRNKTHLFNPITISFYLLPKRGAEFDRRLSLNSVLRSSFEEQVIIGPNYTFTFNNQRTDKDKVSMYFRTNIETAGNIIYAGFKAANPKSANQTYLIANRPFSQYFRIDADWRNHFMMDNHSQFAMRTYVGIGIPYGNSKALPFVKQFFVGGPNSLRGFLIREVGPGGYYDPTPGVYDPETGEKTNTGFFNQTGDIKLETNAEIRFDIYKWLKAAVFVDAGNVWLMRKDTRTNGEFNFKRFWSEFAVDAGAGLRLDFNFFVIRLDYGFPLRDPRRAEGKRWQFKDGQAFKTGQFQLAIGYPF
jgi:outer membrane protein insertion porin family